MIVNPEVVSLIPARTPKTEKSNLHGFELHRLSSKGTKLLFYVIKATINQLCVYAVFSTSLTICVSRAACFAFCSTCIITIFKIRKYICVPIDVHVDLREKNHEQKQVNKSNNNSSNTWNPKYVYLYIYIYAYIYIHVNALIKYNNTINQN